MKYFSRGHVNGEFTDDESEQSAARYLRRLDEISDQLPESLKRLAREIPLHDAVLERVVWDPGRETLAIHAVVESAGEPRSALSVEMAYGGAMLGESRLDTLKASARDRETVILQSEVDVDDRDGTFVHRLLFWPRDEVTIDFRTFGLHVRPRDGWGVELGGAFQIVPSDEDE